MSFGVPQFLGSFVLCGPVDKWRRQVSCDLESYAKVDGSRTMICTLIIWCCSEVKRITMKVFLDN